MKKVKVNECMEFFGGDDYDCETCGERIVVDGNPQMEKVYKDTTYSFIDSPARFKHFFCSEDCLNDKKWQAKKKAIEESEKADALNYKYNIKPYQQAEYTVCSGGLPSLGKRR